MRYRVNNRLHLGRLRWVVEGRNWWSLRWQVVDWQAATMAEAHERKRIHQGRQLPSIQNGKVVEL